MGSGNGNQLIAFGFEALDDLARLLLHRHTLMCVYMRTIAEIQSPVRRARSASQTVQSVRRPRQGDLRDLIVGHVVNCEGIARHEVVDVSALAPGKDHAASARHLAAGGEEQTAVLTFLEPGHMRLHQAVRLFLRLHIGEGEDEHQAPPSTSSARIRPRSELPT